MNHHEGEISVDEARTNRSHGLNVELCLYLLLGIGALWIRLAGLGTRPLTPTEAQWGLVALGFTPESANPAVSPVWVALARMAFLLFGATDFTARLPAALAGGLIPLAFYPLRGVLGRREALLAAALAASSPLWVFASRNANGDILVTLAVLVALGAIAAYRQSRYAPWLYLAAASAGVAMVSGPAVYTFAAMGVVLLMAGRVNPLGLLPRGESARKAALALAGGLFLAATALLFNPAGLGQGAEQLAVWAGGFAEAGMLRRLLSPVTLLLYEPLLTLLAVIALIPLKGESERAAVRPAPLVTTKQLLACAAAGLGIQMLRGDSGPGAMLPVLLPLTVLAARGASKTWDALRRGEESSFVGYEVGVLLSVAVYVFLTLAGYSFTGMRAFGILALASTLALGGLLAAIGMWRGGREAAQVGIAAALAVALLWHVRLGWALNFGPLLHQRHLPLPEFTSPEVRDVVASLHRLSSYRTGDPDALRIGVGLKPTPTGDSPVLRWYVLREFPNAVATVGAGLKPALVGAGFKPAPTTAVIAPAGAEIPLGEGYRGRDFTLTVRWHPTSLRGRDFLRWLLYRDARGTVDEEKAVLWVKQ